MGAKSALSHDLTPTPILVKVFSASVHDTACIMYGTRRHAAGALRLVTYYSIYSSQCLNFMHYEGILVKKKVQELSDKNERG